MTTTKRSIIGGCVLALALVLAACVPDATTSGPWTDANADGLHQSTETIPCDQLTQVSGMLFSDYASTTTVNVSNVSIHGGVEIRQSHVHFNNVCIFGNGPAVVKIRSEYGDPNGYSPVDIIFTNTAIAREVTKITDPTTCGDEGNNPPDACIGERGIWLDDHPVPPGYSGTTLTVVGSRITDVGHAIDLNIQQAKVDIESNYLEGHLVRSKDHVDGILCNGGCRGGTMVKNNNIVLGSLTQTTPLAMYNAQVSQNNWVIDGNQFQGGSYCSYAGSPGATNITFTNNTFVTNGPFPLCGDQGMVNVWNNDPSNTWSGNKDSAGNIVQPTQTGT